MGKNGEEQQKKQTKPKKAPFKSIKKAKKETDDLNKYYFFKDIGAAKAALEKDEKNTQDIYKLLKRRITDDGAWIHYGGKKIVRDYEEKYSKKLDT